MRELPVSCFTLVMVMFLLIFIFFSLGYVLSRLLTIPDVVPRGLNKSVIYIALPAVILLAAPSLSLNSALLFPILAYWLPLPLIWWLATTVSRRLGWERDYYWTAFALMVCGNTAYFGIPMVKTLVGEAGLPFALAYDQLGSFLGLTLVLPVFFSLNGAEGQARVDGWKIVRKLFVFPPFVTLLICLFLPIADWVALVETPLRWLGKLIIPLTMLALGMHFRLKIERKALSLVGVVIGGKMMLLPVLIWSAGTLFGLPSTVVAASTLQGAMPPMITAAVLLMSSGVRSSLVAAVLSAATLWAFIQTPVLGWLLHP